MLGGCALVNLTLFERLHAELQYPNEMVEPKGSPQWPRLFYGNPYLYWINQLNLPLEQFKKQFTVFTEYGHGNAEERREKLEWLKEWEEDARREGLYTIQS